MSDIVNIDWQLLGARLVNLSDEEQSLFFKGFLNELDTLPSHYEKEMQMVHIRFKLTDKEKKLAKNYLNTIGWEETANDGE